MLRTELLTKVYHTKHGEIRAVDDVSLTVNDGEIMGLLGLNGSGKTILLRILAGLVIQTGGTIFLDETPVTNPSSRVNMVAEGGRSLYWRLTVEENLLYLGSLRRAPVQSISEILEAFDLEGNRCILQGPV